MFSEIGLLVDEEALISEYQKKLMDLEQPSAREGEHFGKMLMVESFIDAYGMVSDKNVEDAVEKNKELNTVFLARIAGLSIRGIQEDIIPAKDILVGFQINATGLLYHTAMDSFGCVSFWRQICCP